MDAFRDRVCVITGAAGGIGSALARALAHRGARLALADLDRNRLDRLCEDLAREGADVLGVPTDVTQPASVEALAERVESHFGSLHTLFNNAGIAVAGPLAQATPADWERTMAVNFWGMVYGIQSFVPRLIAQSQGGRIVNTASMAGLAGMQFLGIYSASKFAIVGVSEALLRELRSHGIQVAVLCPMMVDTAMTRGALGGSSGQPPEGLQGGLISAEEVAVRVLRGLERGDFYIVTHTAQREILRRRGARLDAMFEEAVFRLPDEPA